jgi:hypothetical protein
MRFDYGRVSLLIAQKTDMEQSANQNAPHNSEKDYVRNTAQWDRLFDGSSPATLLQALTRLKAPQE